MIISVEKDGQYYDASIYNNDDKIAIRYEGIKVSHYSDMLTILSKAIVAAYMLDNPTYIIVEAVG